MRQSRSSATSGCPSTTARSLGGRSGRSERPPEALREPPARTGEGAGRRARWTLGEIASAAGGRIVQGDPAVRAEGVSTDTRTLRPGEAFVALRGKRFEGHDYLGDAALKGASCALVEESGLGRATPSAGALPLVAVNDTTRALGRLASSVRVRSAVPRVAVTGSAGKTTTKELIAAALSPMGPVLKSPRSFNNSIGVPLTVLALRDDHRAAVIEIGMSSPGEIAPLAAIARATVAVVTTVGPAHLERFGSVEDIAREKAEVLRALPADGVAVLPADSDYLDVLRESAPPRVVTFGFSDGADVRAGDVRALGDGGSAFRAGGHEVRLRLAGRANVSNALAALAVADALGVSREDAAEGISRVRPLTLRGRLRHGRRISVYEDCYNANPLSFAAALAAWSAVPAARRWVVAGDMRELGARSRELHEELGRSIARAGAEALVAVGEFAPDIARGAAKVGTVNGPIIQVDTVQQAEKQAKAIAREGDLVLVKASRAVGLERVVEALLGTEAPGAATGRRREIA